MFAYDIPTFITETHHLVTQVQLFLNQARAGHKPVHAWFLKIDPVRIVGMHACVRVCVSAPEAINN